MRARAGCGVFAAGTNPTDAEDNLGLVRADFVTKEPAFAAFEKAMRRRRPGGGAAPPAASTPGVH